MIGLVYMYKYLQKYYNDNELKFTLYTSSIRNKNILHQNESSPKKRLSSGHNIKDKQYVQLYENSAKNRLPLLCTRLLEISVQFSTASARNF